MLPRFCSATLGVLVCLLGGQPARADIYTWVDASGMTHISNLSPPAGAHVVSVLQEEPQELLAREDAARNAARQAELWALSDRVRELERAVASAQPPPPPQVIYVPAPAAAQYPTNIAPPAPVQYQANVAAPVSYGCDPWWADCWSWWGPGLYSTGVVVVGGPDFHRHRPGRPGHHFADATRPVRGHHLRFRGIPTTSTQLQSLQRTHRSPLSTTMRGLVGVGRSR
jgi:Domain of unknown function (DUF4124)